MRIMWTCFLAGIAKAFDDEVAFNEDLVQKCRAWFKVKEKRQKMI